MIAIDETGSGEPLVLLHGVGASRVIWSRATAKLAARRRVLAPDLPGFGESPAVGPGFELEEVAAQLAEVLAERSGERFDLVGNSLGGAVALMLSFLRPELVRCLVLVAPAGFSPAPWPLAIAAGRVMGPAIELRRRLGSPLVAIPAARRALLWGAIAQPQRLGADDAATMLGASRGSTRVGSAVSTVLQADLRPVLAEVDVPLGLIWGKRDRIVPISTLRLIQAIRPDAAMATIADAGHVPQVERPARFVAALERVLERAARREPEASAAQQPSHTSVRRDG